MKKKNKKKIEENSLITAMKNYELSLGKSGIAESLGFTKEIVTKTDKGWEIIYVRE